MQENNPVLMANSPLTTEVQFVSEPNDQQPKTNSFLVILLSILLVISLAIAGFFAFQTQKLVKELTVLKTEEKNVAVATTEPVATQSSETDPTANWKTYTNNLLKYTIKYPTDWTLDKSEAELPINDQNSQRLIISKGQYKVTILWPAAFGPSICLFDDESRNNAPEMAGYCEGKFIEIKSNNNKDIKRRLEKPSVLTDHTQWPVYTKSQGYFVSVPPTSFEAPIIYDSQVIKTMDQILSSYVYTN